MTHPLVDQLRFTRSEFKRCLKGLSTEDAAKRILPMNCIAWNVGHMAWHEQNYFLKNGLGKVIFPELNDLYGYGSPASTPDLEKVLKMWNKVTRSNDIFLESINNEKLQSFVLKDGKPTKYIWGNLLQRVIYHYWYHIGENAAIRQSLGHTNLPEFEGNVDKYASFHL